MIDNVNQNASLETYQVNRCFEVVVVFVHAILVVCAALPLTFCVIFQNVITHKPRSRVVIRGTSSKKSQRDFVPSTHPGTHELVLSTEKQ